jgi:hypothetical protein
MPSKSPAQRLSDIIDNVDAISAFSADLVCFAASRDTLVIVISGNRNGCTVSAASLLENKRDADGHREGEADG